MLAYYVSLAEEDLDPASWQVIKYISSAQVVLQNEAGNFIERQLEPFLMVKDELSADTPFLDVLECFYGKNVPYCDFSGEYILSFQAHIFHSDTGTKIASYPEKYNPELRQFYFMGITNGTLITNVELIINILGFF